ncbi:hypothetical protein LguiA_023714 [Lonicera macranthoides]
MSAYKLLELTLVDILRVINPSSEDRSIRRRVIEELRTVVHSVESLRGCIVEPYGSFVSDLFTRWGDLDISIELLNGSFISLAGKRQKQTSLRNVLRALRKKDGWCKFELIANARVPILKLESNYHGISCDISINNLSGKMKSKLLFLFNQIDGRFRDMVLLVKEWAQAHDINDSKSGTLNSYCLSLLIIFHFQTCVPAILPPLKQIYPGNMVRDLTGMRADAEKYVEETCAMNINRFRSSRLINRSSLSELFMSFIAKFRDLSLRASEQGISLYSGRWEDIESNSSWLPKTYALFVEDPFEQPANCARTVSSGQLTKIAEAFQTTHSTLISRTQSQNHLVSSLVRRQIFHLMSRTPPLALARNHPSSNFGGDHSRARPQVQSAFVHSPSPVQRQFHKPRMDGRSNNIHRLVQQAHYYSPGQQQTWRPVSDR